MESGPETEKTKQITKLTLAITLLIRFIPTTYNSAADIYKAAILAECSREVALP